MLLVFRSSNLLANVDNYTFCVDNIDSLVFVVNKEEIHIDPKNIKAIQNVGKIGSVHGLMSFYQRFV